MTWTQFTNSAEYNLFSQFRFARYRLTMKVLGDIHLIGFKGSAIRGSFGYAFRQVMCVIEGMRCEECPTAGNCFYVYAFETKGSYDDAFLRNKGEIVRPYILRPPQDGRDHYRRGDELVFELILFGTATDYLKYFAAAFIQMGQQGLGNRSVSLLLDRMESIGKSGGTTIYRSGDNEFRRIAPPLTAIEVCDLEPPSRCAFNFITPLELKEKGRYPDVSFGLLFRSLLRRVVTLAHIHCDIDCSDIDFTSLSRKADTVQTLSNSLDRVLSQRYSSRQQSWMPMGGRLGKIAFEGDLTPFWPFLVLGEHVHVGKKTSFGFGQYELIVG
ncbi:MAG TPA: CRISPR system precrRNA processing endoribonuclease RAMP protein Cas6 [Syntrophorhabdus sp.]|nr:CRISPR system precrRNA processing endoribonuclease RAMP protein Cas6 [Syntrophorhabdus sp.]